MTKKQEQEQEIRELTRDLQEIVQQRRREKWDRITWWIVIPFSIITMIAAWFVE